MAIDVIINMRYLNDKSESGSNQGASVSFAGYGKRYKWDLNLVLWLAGLQRSGIRADLIVSRATCVIDRC